MYRQTDYKVFTMLLSQASVFDLSAFVCVIVSVSVGVAWPC